MCGCGGRLFLFCSLSSVPWQCTLTARRPPAAAAPAASAVGLGGTGCVLLLLLLLLCCLLCCRHAAAKRASAGMAVLAMSLLCWAPSRAPQPLLRHRPPVHACVQLCERLPHAQLAHREEVGWLVVLADLQALRAGLTEVVPELGVGWVGCRAEFAARCWWRFRDASLTAAGSRRCRCAGWSSTPTECAQCAADLHQPRSVRRWLARRRRLRRDLQLCLAGVVEPAVRWRREQRHHSRAVAASHTACSGC